MDKPPARNDKTSRSENKSLHYIFQISFQGTNAEHLGK